MCRLVDCAPQRINMLGRTGREAVWPGSELIKARGVAPLIKALAVAGERGQSPLRRRASSSKQ